MPNKKVLVVAPHPNTEFGFARISRPIIDILIDDHGYTKEDLIICDTSKLRGLPADYRGVPVISMIGSGNGSIFQTLPGVVTDFCPKLVICFGDIWDHFFIYDLKKSLGFEIVYYANVESEHIPTKLLTEVGPLIFKEAYEKVDHLVAYSNFGARELEKVINKKVPFIYHFVDTSKFFKMENFDKRQIFKNIPEDSFIVTTVAVNGFRKSLDMICASFANMIERLSAEDRAKTFLYLHTNMTGTVGWDLQELTDMYGISSRVLLNNGIAKYGAFVSDDEMNRIYNASDVFINLSRGEGFGLGLIEACSAGCRIAFLDYATPHEIMKDEDGRIPVAIKEVRPNNVMSFSALPDPKVAGEKLATIRYQRAKVKPKYNRVVSDNIALSKRFDKSIVLDEWRTFLKPIIEKQPPKVIIGINRL